MTDCHSRRLAAIVRAAAAAAVVLVGGCEHPLQRSAVQPRPVDLVPAVEQFRVPEVALVRLVQTSTLLRQQLQASTSRTVSSPPSPAIPAADLERLNRTAVALSRQFQAATVPAAAFGQP